MDWLPLIPKNDCNNDISPIVPETFQDYFHYRKIPVNLTSNTNRNKSEDNEIIVKIKETSTEDGTQEIEEGVDQVLLEIESAEKKIILSHGKALTNIFKDLTLCDFIKLKRREFFEKLCNESVMKYGLLEKNDLLPHNIIKYLDFTFNLPLHTCKEYCKLMKIEKNVTVTNVEAVKKQKVSKVQKSKIDQKFLLEPEKIIFHNYELNISYKRKFRLRNKSRNPESFSFSNFSKDIPIKVQMLSDSCRLAPGMCADFLITFTPTIYKNISVQFIFKSLKGEDARLKIICSRDFPKLKCYIFNSIWIKSLIKKPTPGSQHFSEKRCKALNFTVDCGTCILGNSSLITLIMKNEGHKGTFFISTEQEWYFENYQALKTRQLKQSCFLIFPTYFEIDNGETCEIFILFQPEVAAFYNEKFILVCNNNACQEIEIVGDCVTFDSSMFKIDLYLLSTNCTYDEHQLIVSANIGETTSIIVTITNNSALYFDYYWTVQKKEMDPNRKLINPNWIHILNITKCLPSYSSTDFVFEILPQTDEEDTYFTFLSLYIKNIPVKGLPITGICLCDEYAAKNETNESNEDLMNIEVKYADVELCKLEIKYVLKEALTTSMSHTEGETVEQHLSEKNIDKTRKPQKLTFSRTFIHFGVIYKGTQCCKSLTIESLTKESLRWKIVEIRLKPNSKLTIYTNIQNLNKSEGYLTEKKHKQKIKYYVRENECTRWISALILLSSPKYLEEFTLESICIVTYDVSEVNIVLHNSINNLPVLYPKELLYVKVPSVQKIYVHNCGSLTGCFYFLKPVGRDVDKVQIQFVPQSGIVHPGTCAVIDVHILPLEEGIIEDFNVPCFTGNVDETISLNFVCAISGINLFFYLPNTCQIPGYNKILWPKYRKDTNIDWNCYFGDKGEDWAPMEQEDKTVEKSIESFNNNIMDLVGWNSVALTYPTVEMKQVQIKQRSKITFYIENVSPIRGNFAIEATNFGIENDCVNSALIKARALDPKAFWQKNCENGYGIIVEPHISCGDIVGFEIIDVNIWVYATTWGRYLEEIIVEVDNITPFCFNLLIEVVGLPIEFPFSTNTILHHPTIRFGTLAYNSDPLVRHIEVTNISSIPVNITWHVFKSLPNDDQIKAPFNCILNLYGMDNFREEFNILLTDKYFGSQLCDCFHVEPRELWLEKKARHTFKLMLYTNRFKQQKLITPFKFNIIGFLHIKESDGLKENYFKRWSEGTLLYANLVATGELEQAFLELENEDETTIDVFVNNLILKKTEETNVCLRFRNCHKASILFSVSTEKPFSIQRINNADRPFEVNSVIELKTEENLEISVSFEMTYEDLIKFAEYIYKNDNKNVSNSSNYTSIIRKSLIFQQREMLPQIVPMELRLHYPHVEINPTFLEFGSCLVFNTKQSLITIYNLTACAVKFEIYKTSANNDFEIVPSHGELPPTTGANKRFIDLMVYFSPREVKTYIETIKILTNIPQYFIDIPVNGNGSSNEKFQNM